MHVLMIAIGFPSPDNPYPGSFIAEQVRLLCEHVERITVLCPIPRIPTFLPLGPSISAKATLPSRYYMRTDRCEVLFPRYLKAPGNTLLCWTTAQWCRIVSNTVAELNRRHPVSIIHAHAGSVSAWSAIKAARRYHLPCVVTYQGSEVHDTLVNRNRGWKLCRDAFRFADLNISVSRSLQRILNQHVTPEGRCEVILRGVDQTKFFPPVHGVRKPIVLFVGRITTSKGVFDLLAAWKHVLEGCPYAELWMVGSDSTNGTFARESQSQRYGHSIKMTGPLPSADVASLMQEAQILCLPSHGEGMPNCVMEALASGLPVVATKVGGIPDIIQTGVSGILVDKGDVRSLAAALVSLLTDSDSRTAMGKEGYHFALEHLNGKRNVLRLTELYIDLVKGNRSQDIDTHSVCATNL